MSLSRFNTGETPEDLKKKYNSEGTILRKAQLRMLDMLLYLDKVCREQNISYRIDAGNVLGAIRHGGFIPWDDDVDNRGSDYLLEIFTRIATTMDVSSSYEAISFLNQMMYKMEMYQLVSRNREEELSLLSSSVNPVRLKNNPVSLKRNEIRNIYNQILNSHA